MTNLQFDIINQLIQFTDVMKNLEEKNIKICQEAIEKDYSESLKNRIKNLNSQLKSKNIIESLGLSESSKNSNKPENIITKIMRYNHFLIIKNHENEECNDLLKSKKFVQLDWYYHITFPETNMVNISSKQKFNIEKTNNQIPIFCPNLQNDKKSNIQELNDLKSDINKENNQKICSQNKSDSQYLKQTNKSNKQLNQSNIIVLIRNDDNCGDNSYEHYASLDYQCEVKQNEDQVSIRTFDQIRLTELFKKHHKLNIDVQIFDDKKSEVDTVNLFNRFVSGIHYDKSKFDRINKRIIQKILGNKLSYYHELYIKKSFAISSLIKGDQNDHINERIIINKKEVNQNLNKSFNQKENEFNQKKNDQINNNELYDNKFKDINEIRKKQRFKNKLISNNKILKQDDKTAVSSPINLINKNQTNLNDDTIFESITPHQKDQKELKEVCYLQYREENAKYVQQFQLFEINYAKDEKLMLDINNEGKCIIKSEEINQNLDIQITKLENHDIDLKIKLNNEEVDQYGVLFYRMTTEFVIESKEYLFQPPISIICIKSELFQSDTIFSRMNIDYNNQNLNTNQQSYLKYSIDDKIESKQIIPDTVAIIQLQGWDSNQELNNQLNMAFFSQSQYQQYNLSFKMLNIQVKKDINDIESPKDKNIDMQEVTDVCQDCFIKLNGEQVDVKQCEGICFQ